MDANVSICGPNLSAVMPQSGLKKAVLVAAGGIGAGRHGARGHGGAAVRRSAVTRSCVMCHVSPPLQPASVPSIPAETKMYFYSRCRVP